MLCTIAQPHARCYAIDAKIGRVIIARGSELSDRRPGPSSRSSRCVPQSVTEIVTSSPLPREKMTSLWPLYTVRSPLSLVSENESWSSSNDTVACGNDNGARQREASNRSSTSKRARARVQWRLGGPGVWSGHAGRRDAGVNCTPPKNAVRRVQEGNGCGTATCRS